MFKSLWSKFISKILDHRESMASKGFAKGVCFMHQPREKKTLIMQ